MRGFQSLPRLDIHVWYLSHWRNFEDLPTHQRTYSLHYDEAPFPVSASFHFSVCAWLIISKGRNSLEQSFLERNTFQHPTGSLILRLHVSQIRLLPGAKSIMTKLILISNWAELWSAFQGLSLETKHGGTEAINPLISHLKLSLTWQQ